MKEVLLFGINEMSERIAYYIEQGESVRPFSVKGYVIDDDYYNTDTFAGKKIYRYSEARENFLQTSSVIICIGYKNMNENRKKIFHKLRDDGWDIESFISSQSVISTDNIGMGNILLRWSVIEFGCSLGDCNVFDSGYLGHHSKMGSFNFFTGNACGGNVVVGDCCFVGMRSTIRNSITLHDKTFIGAACYMNHSTTKPGMSYAAPKAVRLGDSERVMETFTSM